MGGPGSISARAHRVGNLVMENALEFERQVLLSSTLEERRLNNGIIGELETWRKIWRSLLFLQLARFLPFQILESSRCPRAESG